MTNVLAQGDGKTFVEMSIRRREDFQAPFPGSVFPCLIWDHGSGWAGEARLALAATLLASGCRYAVCGGAGCSAWHDAVDLAFVNAHPDESAKEWDAAFVMTTWHEGESPDDVAFFFVVNTYSETHEFQQYLVLHIGESPAREQVNAAVRAWALGKRVTD